MKTFTFIIGLLFCMHGNAQYVFEPGALLGEVSLYRYAQMADAGMRRYTPEEIISNKSNLVFYGLNRPQTNIGFTENFYWVKFELINRTTDPIMYYLETARPVTDEVELYLTGKDGKLNVQKSGDKMPFNERILEHRKTIFRINLKAGETIKAYMQLKSDGEVLSLPLVLRSSENLLHTTYYEQLIFGIFYGILILASITYLFFFFALGERVFLYYSGYVIFIALLQFSLDGYFFQYFTPGGGWFSQRAVIIFATLSGIFLGKYGEVFLNIKQYSAKILNAFKVVYSLLGLLLIAVLFIPGVLSISYPLANTFGLGILGLIVLSLVYFNARKLKFDKFFGIGVFFLFLGFVIFIFNNFGILPNSFLTENSPKLGTGLEIIFLSLSMGNRIRLLKTEKENAQASALIRSQEMNDVKSFFLSNMSHELRTPLNAIIGLINIMDSETSDEKIKNNCEVIRYASNNLLSSVNDILDFSRMEKQELRLEQVNFEPDKIFEQVKYNAEKQAKDKGLSFEFSCPANLPDVIKGDPARLSQIVNNVLNNAIKFTNEGFVKFSIDTIIKENNTVSIILTIADSGVGIAKEKIDTIFEAFTQENINDKRKFGGFGLGLCIVKALVDLHDGDLEMTSTVGKGTVCRIFLNYEIISLKKEIKPEQSLNKFDLNGAQILVVEDNPVNQMVLKMMFKKWENTVVRYASNGLEGVEMLKNHKTDLVLMDLQMPVMDGYEATIAIRNKEAGLENASIPIIAVTADIMDSTKDKVMAIGMNDYMTKPVDQKLLYEKISSLLATVVLVQPKVIPASLLINEGMKEVA